MRRLSTLALILALGSLRADEGMWTFDNLPLRQLKQAHGFEPSQAWLDHLRLSVVRFPGGTGSFVSGDGLVLTNHHVARGWIQLVSGPGQKDYQTLGFVAGNRAAELRIPGAELFTLEGMVNVTEKVEGAAAGASDEKAAAQARAKAKEFLRAEHEKATGLTCEPVTLYQGGETWIYQYKKHTDIRLVMAPEGQMAHFGGDPDNFTYPRWGLDFTLLRVYENGQPYTPSAFLRWSQAGLKAGDLTFVAGHPGSTARLETLAQMRLAGEVTTPLRLEGIGRQLAALRAYSARSEEAKRQARTIILNLENSQKAITGYLAGLKDPAAMARIEAAERELQAKVAADPALGNAKDSWARIADAMVQARPLTRESAFISSRNSALLADALTLVRLPVELAKPNDLRLADFKETRLPAIRRRLAVSQPFHPELEIARFEDGLKDSLEALGAGHPFVKALLDGKSPRQVAEAAVRGSKLGDAAERKRLLEGGASAVAASQDPMILLAQRLDPLLRDLRTRQEALEAVVAEHGGRIARARFAAYGKARYPDATGSLRLTFGTVTGYPANGTEIQPFTTFFGLYDRHFGQGGSGHWALPERWLQQRGALDLSVPYNFSHKVDIIGGNSGSPVVDRKGELVGLIFDGNIESLPGRYFYDEAVNRGVSVDARAIVHALDKVYHAPHLVRELTGK